MKFIADFHIHSKYSRATSRDMDIEALSQWAKWKGIQLLGTGDFTHPLWLQNLQEKLQPVNYGLYEYDDIQFMLTAEVCNIFYVGGKAKKIHNLIFAPDFETVEKINKELAYFGNLSADGRPILNVEAKELVKVALGASPDCAIVPAHIWTPHFSLFGSNADFNTIEECFEEEAKNIFALETGLSADPAMCWRLSALDRFSLISNSDSHSPNRIGREANIFDCQLDYKTIMQALKTKDKTKFLSTVEFYPQEGKYHWDGHRVCQVSMHPQETIKSNLQCPKCGRKMTIGVMHRVEKLSDRPEGFTPQNSIGFQNLIRLVEIIADVKGRGVDTAGVQADYKQALQRLGTEFDILVNVPQDKLEETLPVKIARAIIKVREGSVKIHPGYDGEYGKIHVVDEEDAGEKQMELF